MCVHMSAEWWLTESSQCYTATKPHNSSSTGWGKHDKMKMFPPCISENQSKKRISVNSEVNCIAEKICMTVSRQFAHSVLLLPLPLPLHSLLPPPPHPPVPSFLPLTKQMEVSVDFHLTHARAELPGSFACSGVRSCLFRSQRFLCWPSCAVGLHGEVKGRWAVTGAEALRCVSISATSEHTFSPWSSLLKSI